MVVWSFYFDLHSVMYQRINMPVHYLDNTVGHILDIKAGCRIKLSLSSRGTCMMSST